jgi:PKD repeat protein
LIVSANPPVGNVGPAGLTVQFFVVASGGIAPYAYAWDFNGDNQTDSTTSSGQWVYTTPGAQVARITVTDANQQVVTATRTITVGADTSGPATPVLSVRFNASPQTGNVGFKCNFQAYISGGVAPYHYQWDFDCDLAELVDLSGIIRPPATAGAVPTTFVPDAFTDNPVWTYAQVGPHASDTPANYTVYPVLYVIDGANRKATNLDDNFNNGNPTDFSPDGLPDFNLGISVIPMGGGLLVAANANPLVGQAPLTVEFTGSVTGGSGNYEFSWNFGEGAPTPFNASSLATHTYLNTGTYLAVVTVRDMVTTETAITMPLQVQATTHQAFSLIITSDIGSKPAGYYDESGDTSGFGIPTGVVGNITDGQILWNEKRTWGTDPPLPGPAGQSCADCHAGGKDGRTFQQFRAAMVDPPHDAGTAPTGTDLTNQELADVTAYANRNGGYEFANGEVPFVVNLMSNPANGQEPIVYQWDVFDEYGDPAGPPSIVNPANPQAQPGLDSTAVVTPDFSYRKNPAMHFANTSFAAGQDATGNTIYTPRAAKSYAVRCVARDAAGNTSVSNLIRVNANAHSANSYYLAHRPFVEFSTYFPAFTPANGSANPLIAASSGSWAPRANAAIATHPTGISFIIGGEHLDENGEFSSLVTRGDSMYMYIPESAGTGTGEGFIGKFNCDPNTAALTDASYPADANYGRGGSIVALNASTGPSFPNTPNFPPNGGPNTGYPDPGMDTRVPARLETDMTEPVAYVANRRPTSRSNDFVIVGSAAAVFMHEPPETNPAGAYPPAGTYPPDGNQQGPGTPESNPTDDVDEDLVYLNPTAALNRLYSWPDSPPNPFSPKHWQIDDPTNPTVTPGLGSPVIYVIGGRTGANTPTDLVQKYCVYGFGSEDLIPWSDDYQFQTTGNQTDIWSNLFLREDTDQFVGPNSNFDPEIDDRRRGGSGQETVDMPRLPVALYGLMAVKIETGIDAPTFDFPYGGYSSVFIFGGIDANGSVSDEMRWWNTTLTAEQGDDPGADGIFSVVSNIPTPRAYGKAVLIPTNPPRVALVGGFDQQGVPIDTIDVFEFGSIYNPSGGGSWSTFAGTLPEALEACAAGYNDRGEPGESWVLAFGGWTGAEFNYHNYNARLRSAGNLVVSLAPVVVPRSHAASGQSGSNPLQVAFNRYYILGGVDENGVDSVVEAFGLP